MGCFCFEWNGSKIQRKTLAYLFGIKGSQRHSTGVICLIHQSKVITSILERSKSLLIRQKSQWPVGSMTLLHCLHGIFSSHSPSLQELQKTGASIWMIPEALTQFSIPFTWGGGKPKQKQTKSKPQKMSDLDLKMVQIHVLIICLLQLSSTVNAQRQPKSLL